MGELIRLSDLVKKKKEPIAQEDLIQIGQRVSCGFYWAGAGTVFQIDGQQQPASVRQMGGGIVARGGNAYFDVVFDNGRVSKALPECIIKGGSWQIGLEIASKQEIAAALQYAAELKATENREAEIALKEHERAKIAHQKNYDFLQLNPGRGGTSAAKNLRKELKHNFNGVKFSVRSSYDSINIRWQDGPTEQHVQEVANKYQSGHFNGMEDIYEYNASAFNELFGGCRYVFTARDHSDMAVKCAIDKAYTKFGSEEDLQNKTTVEDFRSGRLYCKYLGKNSHDDLQALIHHEIKDQA